MKAQLARLLAVRKNRLPPGRCACGEPTVKWCTRHGQPLKVSATPVAMVAARLRRAAG